MEKKIFDTVNNQVKTTTVAGQTYLLGREKSDGIHLIKEDGKPLNGCYESKDGGNILVERTAAPAPKTAKKSVKFVKGMSADDKLAALAAIGKASGFVKMTNADGEGSLWKMNGGVPTAVDDKEIETLLGVILDQDYIHNMRIDRSWILPQMKWMLFDQKTGVLDQSRYRSLIINDGMGEAWKLLLHNLGKMQHIKVKDPVAFSIYETQWNRDLAVAMAEIDLKNAREYVNHLPKHGCSKFYPAHLEYVKITALHGRGHYGKMFFTENAERRIEQYIKAGYSRKKDAIKTRAEQQFVSDLFEKLEGLVRAIKYARDTKQLHKAVKAYMDERIDYPMFITQKRECNIRVNGRLVKDFYYDKIWIAKFPEQFISAYKADGAYYSMRTLLRYYGEKLGGSFASKAKRNRWLKDIDAAMYACSGEGYKMFGLMKDFLQEAGFNRLGDFDRLK